MELSLKKILLSNSFMFLCSVIIGYSLWIMLSHHQILQQTITMPVGVFEQQNIIHQSILNVRVEGTRTQLRTLYYHPPQVTFYREEQPENTITVTPNDILLPETVTLIDYWPKTISIF